MYIALANNNMTVLVLSLTYKYVIEFRETIKKSVFHFGHP